MIIDFLESALKILRKRGAQAFEQESAIVKKAEEHVLNDIAYAQVELLRADDESMTPSKQTARKNDPAQTLQNIQKVKIARDETGR